MPHTKPTDTPGVPGFTNLGSIIKRATAAALSLSVAASAPAQEKGALPDGWRDHPDAQTQIRFEPFGIVGGRADFDAGGDVAVRRAGWRLSMRQPVSREWTVALNVENEFTFTNYELPPALGGGDPIDLLSSVRLVPTLSYRIDRRWTASASAIVEFADESGADFGESVRAGGIFTIRSRLSDRLTIGMGVGVIDRFEDSPRFFPAPQIDWRPNDRWRIFTDQLGVNVERALTDSWFLTLRGRFEAREYRLSEGGGSLLPDGVFRDESALIGIELGYRPHAAVEAALEVGAIAHPQIEVLNSRGSEIFDDEADATFFVAGRLRVRF